MKTENMSSLSQLSGSYPVRYKMRNLRLIAIRGVERPYHMIQADHNEPEWWLNIDGDTVPWPGDSYYIFDIDGTLLYCLYNGVISCDEKFIACHHNEQRYRVVTRVEPYTYGGRVDIEWFSCDRYYVKSVSLDEHREMYINEILE